MAEEKKLNRLSNKEKDTQEVQQPTYEELKNYCDQIMMQRNQLAQKLQQITSIVNKLPWLFEVIKSRDVFNTAFVKKCVNEVEEIMIPPSEDEEPINKD